MKTKSKFETDEILAMRKYRNDWKYAREHGLIPKIPFPNSLKTDCITE